MVKMTGRGILIAAASAVCISSGVVFVRFAYQAGLTPGTALFLRFGLAAVMLMIYLRVSRRWTAFPLNEKAALLGLGLAAYTALGVTWFVSLSLIPAWMVSLFAAPQPLLIALGSWLFLKGDFNSKLLLPLVTVVAGGVLLFLQPFSQTDIAGILLMLLNVVVYTVYILVGQGLINRRSPETAVFWILCGAAVGSFFYALAVGQLNFNFAPAGWLWALGLALVATVMAITFLWHGIRLLGPARAAIIGALDPVFSVSLAVFVLGERLTVQQMAGGVLILGGVIAVRILEQ